MRAPFLTGILLAGAGCQSSPPPLPAPSGPLDAAEVRPLAPHVVDATLVHVGENVILLSDLQKAILSATRSETHLGPTGALHGGTLTPAQGEEIMDYLIAQKLMSTRVAELGLQVGEGELDQEIGTFLQGRGLTRDALATMLASEGETLESYRTEFRDQLEKRRLIERAIRPLVSVTREEVLAYYRQQTGTLGTTQTVRLRSLVVHIPAGTPAQLVAAKHKVIALISQKVGEGAEFESLVRLYSESPDASKDGGLLPPRALSAYPEVLQSALRDSVPGGSPVGPITLGTSVFFFQVAQIEAGEGTSEAEFERQRLTYENRLLEIKFTERLAQYLKEEQGRIRVTRRPFVFTKP